MELRLQLLEAYKKRDRQTLEAIRGAKIDAVISALDGLNDSFRRQWLRSYKYYGLEVMQIKLAGLKERYRETSRRIEELLTGKIDSIPELEVEPAALGSTDPRYRMAVTGSWFICMSTSAPADQALLWRLGQNSPPCLLEIIIRLGRHPPGWLAPEGLAESVGDAPSLLQMHHTGADATGSTL